MPTVLVVDDTAVDRRLAGGLLENAPDLDVCYAQNGNEALLRIGNELPDLVLTDLQMPELDGLELVNSMSEKYPDVPVVLMTAHGSEVIAAQALASGAASYVPKTDLADSLVETVMHILAMSESDARYKKLMRCAKKVDFEFELENDLKILDPLIDLVQQVVSSQDILDSTQRVRMCVAVEHALQNAMIRGNLEISREQAPVINPSIVDKKNQLPEFADRRVHFKVSVTQDLVKFLIKDEGKGFDVSNIPAAESPEAFKDGMGRGLVLMQAFMDEV
ncbi:MAG: response regulator [Planctomycetota bacterium]